ncbi:MAG: sterol desaturase family protein [Acidobacteriota bacterium]|nr:sterol desaturase family protein [Blastocatellia bacterium]MDW8413600.1 sterol desaturase family protein [Acidobacteriota bacterium]
MYEIDYRALGYFVGIFLGGLLRGAIIFIPLERFLPLKREQKVFRSGLLTDIVHFGVNTIVIQYFIVQAVLVASSYWFAKLLSLLAGIGFPYLGISLHFLQNFVSKQHYLVQFFIALVIGDLIFYTYHRAAHNNKYLWKLHAIHHSTVELDWLAAYRFHPVEQMITQSLNAIAISILGLDPSQSLLLGLLSSTADPLAHANTKLRFGPLKWVFINPEFHHWHHSTERQAFNKNFAGRLPVLDLIFGTAYLGPAPATSFGIEDPVPTSYLKQLFYPLMKRQRKVSDEVMVASTESVSSK